MFIEPGIPYKPLKLQRSEIFGFAKGKTSRSSGAEIDRSDQVLGEQKTKR